MRTKRSTWRSLSQRLRHSVLDFLALPVLIGIAFILLAEVVDWFDNHAGTQSAWSPLRTWLSQYVGDTQAAIGVLSAIAGSLFTVTSVTFSILLLAVQQGATVLNSQVVDHYLRRRANRAWFGFFVGVSLFVLITLVQTTHTKQPVFGVIVSTLLGAVALTALVILIYSTVDQIRPSTVLHSIVATASAAREKQLAFLAQTAPSGASNPGVPVASLRGGYLLQIDVERVAKILSSQPECRLYMVASIGDYVQPGQPVALLQGGGVSGQISDALADTLTVEAQRDLMTDPAYSLNNIATIGWTAISSAHSDPAVGSIVLNSLQTLLHRWSDEPRRATQESAQIFYNDDLFERVTHALEDMLAATAESQQSQSLARILDLVATSLALLPTNRRKALLQVIPCACRALGDAVPTQPLQQAVSQLSGALAREGAVDQQRDLETAFAGGGKS